jgi:DNA-binding XRE family transcriptional regulator
MLASKKSVCLPNLAYLLTSTHSYRHFLSYLLGIPVRCMPSKLAGMLYQRTARRVDVTYGEQLKRLRLGMQPPMTQQHLADRLGVHVTTISRWETDQSVPVLGQIRPLARALRVPVDLVLPPETVDG